MKTLQLNHLALQVDDMHAWDQHQAATDVQRSPRKPRPDGAEQIFVVEPQWSLDRIVQASDPEMT